jgi:hypothetical protein
VCCCRMYGLCERLRHVYTTIACTRSWSLARGRTRFAGRRSTSRRRFGGVCGAAWQGSSCLLVGVCGAVALVVCGLLGCRRRSVLEGVRELDTGEEGYALVCCGV